MYYLSDINKLNDKDKELNLNDYYLFTKGFSEEECSRIIKENSDRLQVSKQEHTNQDKRYKWHLRRDRTNKVLRRDKGLRSSKNRHWKKL